MEKVVAMMNDNGSQEIIDSAFSGYTSLAAYTDGHIEFCRLTKFWHSESITFNSKR